MPPKMDPSQGGDVNEPPNKNKGGNKYKNTNGGRGQRRGGAGGRGIGRSHDNNLADSMSNLSTCSGHSDASSKHGQGYRDREYDQRGYDQGDYDQEGYDQGGYDQASMNPPQRNGPRRGAPGQGARGGGPSQHHQQDQGSRGGGPSHHNRDQGSKGGPPPPPHQQGPGSRPRQMEQQPLSTEGISAESVQRMIECPVCFEVPRPPIFNCQTGHIICGACRTKISNCPLCRQPFSDARNYVAEQLAESCTFKCPYTEQGCEAKIKLVDEEQHNNVCNFRPIGCEVYPCQNGQIPYSEFLTHMKSKHHSGCAPANHFKFSREVFIKNPGRLMHQGYRPPYIMSCYGHSFLQYTQAIGGKMWFWISLCGTPEEAARYRASIKLYSRDKDLSTTFAGPVHSVRHSGDDIYFNGLCLVTTEECLKAFFHRHPDGFPVYNIQVHIEKIR